MESRVTDRVQSPEIPQAEAGEEDLMELLKKAMETIGSGMQPDECLMLCQYATSATAGAIVEIGSFQGCSTVLLGLASKHGSGAPVFAVDPHVEAVDVFGWSVGPEDRSVFLQNLLRFEVTEIVRPISLPSEQACKAWEGEISMLWIDGDHSYEGTRKDFDGWSPFVPSGGLVLFHDAIDPEIGPFKVIEELLAKGCYRELPGVNSLRVLQKMEATA